MKKTTTFGERLEEALRLAKKDRQQLADALGISVQAVSQVIVGKTKALTAENAARASLHLGVDMLWLCTGEGESTASVVEGKNQARWPFLVPREVIDLLTDDQLHSLDAVMAEFVKIATSASKATPTDDWGAPASSGIISAVKPATSKRLKHG